MATYAIAMALRDKQRVIYTSPIKALSNQKFRELQQEFSDVGLMTGDVTVNPQASCIVMTTEILRNMLYKGTEITREMAWVIFDEVHYMRDKERGVVWEETMILLPNIVKYVFLSATIPNAREFAQWICRIKNQPCNVVYTDYRPVPLQHYLYSSGAEGIYLVVDEKGNFREENFAKAISVLDGEYVLDKIFDKRSKKKQSAEADIKNIISMIKDNDLDPAIVFAFTKRECESSALSLSKFDLTSQEEKEKIEFIFTKAISTIADEDQQLPQIQMMLPLLKKGIGIHHGGLLPIVKESVELIFQEGLIKALFSTETFSMGINMPAKTVVFTAIEKWDGEETRWLSGSEYIQMSGRAGRRGLDDRGITILMLNKKMDLEVIKNILNGKSDPLYSSFHLSYNMIVNMLKVEGINPEYIIKRSFHQFQSEKAVPQIKGKIAELNKQLEIYSSSDTDRLNIINDNLKLKNQIDKYQSEINKIITKPENILDFLIAGRMVKIKDWGWGIIINFTRKQVEMNNQRQNKKIINQINSNKDDNSSDIYIVDCLIYVKNIIDPNNKLTPGDLNEMDGQLGVAPILLSSFEGLSIVKLNLPHDLKDKKNLKNAEKLYFELLKRFKRNLPLMDPIKDQDIKDTKLTELISKKANLEEQLQSFNENKISDLEIEKFKEMEKIKANIFNLESTLKKSKEIVLKDDLKHMKRVLRRLEFTSNEDEVLQKGKVAGLISSGDEILITQMMFEGDFNDIEPPFLCAMLSCFLTTVILFNKKIF